MKKLYLLGGLLFTVWLCTAFFSEPEKVGFTTITLKGKHTHVSYLVEIADTPQKAQKGLTKWVLEFLKVFCL